MGAVVGETDHHASRALGKPYRPAHLLGTLMNTLFDLGVLRLDRRLPTSLLADLERIPRIDPLHV